MSTDRFERDERSQAQERLDRLWSETAAMEGQDLEEPGDESLEIPQLVPGPREGQRETVQARAILEKAERFWELLELLPPEDRTEVEKLMEKVRTSLTDRKWEDVTRSANELSDMTTGLFDY